MRAAGTLAFGRSHAKANQTPFPCKRDEVDPCRGETPLARSDHAPKDQGQFDGHLNYARDDAIVVALESHFRQHGISDHKAIRNFSIYARRLFFKRYSWSARISCPVVE